LPYGSNLRPPQFSAKTGHGGYAWGLRTGTAANHENLVEAPHRFVPNLSHGGFGVASLVYCCKNCQYTSPSRPANLLQVLYFPLIKVIDVTVISKQKEVSMLKILICSIICLVAILISIPLNAETVWRDVSRGIKSEDFRTVAVDPEDRDTVYIRSSEAVYKTTDGGVRWEVIFSVRSTSNVINMIAVDAEAVYAGTSKGLYKSKDEGSTWKRIFSGIGRDEGGVLFVTVDPNDTNVIYIGTGAGLFFSRDRGQGWEKGRGLPSSVHYIAVDHSDTQAVYAAAADGLYMSLDRGVNWAHIRETNVTEDEAFENENENRETEETAYAEIRSIAVSSEDSSKVFAATSRGLLITKDRGRTWVAASSLGLPSRNIRHLVLDENGDIYAATDRGVIKHSMATQSWEEAFKGLGSREVRHISLAGGYPSVFWVVADRGIFKTAPENAPALSGAGNTEEVFVNFANEPTIAEIRQAAIIYAEVHPSKIKKWRMAAARKALLPDLSFEYDKNRDWQSSTYFYSTSTQKYKDDDITRGNDSGWSVSVTWELGELIWNNDQTSIDSRSRYTVQLRDDLLNEVTRLFFERRRLQVAMLVSPSAHIRETLENELRLQELTAGIDALTDSYLSKRLNKM
jgi:photosystem II stability/assembly factor-like uncharacterized protein